ncbi:MAG: SUMF1/EgtB/PvdO family nonheme iron enzyme [Polyangiaceae bacterium]|nr:SUMF1/EgtB/PvdO family nonheme iron enzyme [Polyangiaceae bacterium]MBK8939269.1 SUMF1/EgtB/PvdO family nonheme iron enzyme [Polyangiaceae bacterium]
MRRGARARASAMLMVFALSCAEDERAPPSASAGATAQVSASGPSGASDGPSPLPLTSERTANAPSGSAAPSAAPAAPGRGDPRGACPADMRKVEGRHCLSPEHLCAEWNEVNVTGKVERGQCKRYREPARCLGERWAPMRFCMDTYEWPNQRGAVPRNLTSWQEAKDACEAIGKRLCTDVEFTFACEGEAMRPHVTGFERDSAKCSFDRPYRERTFDFDKHDACLADPACKAALDAIDQRVPAGSLPACVSEDGVFDLNGNVNEWVQLPNKGFSKRAGLKGGWWGPVRDRCRPITTFHGESDYGYEVGFRCCKDASP